MKNPRCFRIGDTGIGSIRQAAVVIRRHRPTVLPPAMAPKPKMGLTMYHLFKFFHVKVCQAIILIFPDVVGDMPQTQMIVSARGTLHVSQKYSRIHLFSDTFRAGEHRCVLMQKVYPVMYAVAAGRLIGNEPHNGRTAFAFETQYVAQRLILRDVFSPETRTQLKEQPVEVPVAQRTVKLRTMRCLLRSEEHTSELQSQR